MVDGKGRVVGLVFDGNIHSIAGSFWFDERVNRRRRQMEAKGKSNG